MYRGFELHEMNELMRRGNRQAERYWACINAAAIFPAHALFHVTIFSRHRAM